MIGMLAYLSAAMPGQCYAAARNIDPGMPLASRDVVSVPCRQEERPAAMLAYDGHAGVAVTRILIPVGTYLGEVTAIGDDVVANGDTVTLRSSVGAVTIERPVSALQHGRSGDRIFVQDADGAIFAAQFVVEAP
ncbi:flagella basal body P-ring formation protein FlgA [Sphingosinithalassobacter portus]|uniref:flagella basal body P-ring formation protein FlgA n=1 Tax=Stakelama portus TaxID=2676234 RepID=UPI000D6E2DCD|nr:flagella basal body P-ring formation protein FlgA [Sphingosinithalassobacter portus]